MLFTRRNALVRNHRNTRLLAVSELAEVISHQYEPAGKLFGIAVGWLRDPSL
jgi:hypothetical protein